MLEVEAAANVQGAPQTTAPAPTGEVTVSLGAVSLGWLDLPPDRADSRGILSHVNGPEPGGGWGVVRRTVLAPVAGPMGAEVELRLEAAGEGAGA